MKGKLLHNILFILFLLPVQVFAQPASLPEVDITGLWKGSLYNDTTNKYLPYEIAISEEKGILSGYSYTLFDIDGKKELGVKRIKLKIKGDQVIIEDIVLIANNYTAPPPRKVRQISVVTFSANDTMMQLAGKWSTNRTREYLPLTGSLQLEHTIDYKPQLLFQKLVELHLDQDLSFVKAERKPAPDIAIKEISIPAIKEGMPGTNRPQPVPRKPAELAMVKPGADTSNAINSTVAIEKPADVLVSDPVLTKSKPAIELEKRTAIAVVNNPVIKPPKPLPERAVKSAADTAKAINSTAAVVKPVVLFVKDTVIIKPKPARELVIKPEDKTKPVISPLTDKKTAVIIAANENKKEKEKPVIDKPVPITPPLITKKPAIAVTAKPLVKKENLPVAEVVTKPVLIEKSKAVNTPVVKKPAPVVVVKEQVKPANSGAVVTMVPAEPKTPLPAAFTATGVKAAANVSERKMNKEQFVYFESDSLVLTLYDNGDVDGDTVSVLMNGQVIFARQGLSTKANTKTIYMDKGMQDSVSMIMYAENLGSIPPNTGLLIIMDGAKRYEVRFSADLKTNAGILLRRRVEKK